MGKWPEPLVWPNVPGSEMRTNMNLKHGLDNSVRSFLILLFGKMNQPIAAGLCINNTSINMIKCM